MQTKRRQVVFITGASSGIGNTCATFLAKRGHSVYGTSRTPRSKARMADEFFNLIEMDPRDDLSVQKAFDMVLQKEGHIDLLVCNAGMGFYGPAELTPMPDALRLMDVNFFGVARTIASVLPSMRNEGNGTILIIGSLAGKTGLPFSSFYAASKHALEGYVESIRTEIGRFGIRIALIEPGHVRSGFTASRELVAIPEDSPYFLVAEKARKVLEVDERHGIPPVAIARLVQRLMYRTRLLPRYFIGNWIQSLSVFFKPFLPASFYESVLMDYFNITPDNKEQDPCP